MGNPQDELVTFPTPKEAFGRASQPRPQSQPKRKPPPGFNNAPQRPQQRQQQRPSQQMGGHQQYQQYQQSPQPQHQPQHQPQYLPQQRVPPPPPQQHYQQQMPPQGYQQPQVARPHNTGGSSFVNQAPHNEFQYRQQPPAELRQPNPIAMQNTSEAERVELRLRDLFNKVDRNRSGALGEAELSLALFNTDKSQFQSSTVRLMIRLFDKDGSGTIDFREFYHLWNYISHWRTVFGVYDKDKSNTITFSEYQETLKSFGYRLPTDTVLFVFQKFSHGGGGIYLKFDSYVESLIWLLRCTNSFKKFDSQETGVAVFPFDKYVQEVLGFQ